MGHFQVTALNVMLQAKCLQLTLNASERMATSRKNPRWPEYNAVQIEQHDLAQELNSAIHELQWEQ